MEQSLVALRLRKTPFVGIECEGPNTGQRILFLPGSTGTYQAAEALIRADKKYDDIKRIYYGAGNDRVFRKDTFALLSEICLDRGLGLDVECEEFHKELIHRREGITVILVPPTKGSNFLKYFTPCSVVWVDIQKHTEYRTKIDDPTFSKDEYV